MKLNESYVEFQQCHNFFFYKLKFEAKTGSDFNYHIEQGCTLHNTGHACLMRHALRFNEARKQFDNYFVFLIKS